MDRPDAYLDAYSAHTDQRVERDPQQAVGGNWQLIGKLQFDFLVDAGLLPCHQLLDIGCGTLRGGRHFIGYLDAGNYSGSDISRKAIEYAAHLVVAENLADKRPRLLLSSNKTLTFAEVEGERFDFVLAHSIFTHLKPEHIAECFRHLSRVMHTGSAFFFTFCEAPTYVQRGRKDFSYPRSFFESLANRHNFELQDSSIRDAHQRRQRMVKGTMRGVKSV